MSGGDPGIVGAKAPDVTFRIAAGVAPATVVLVLDLHDDLRARRDGSRVVPVRIFDDDVGALGADAAQIAGGFWSLPKSSSPAEPSMIMPFPKTSCAWTIVPFWAGTTRCSSKPKAWHSQSMTPRASLYLIVGITVAVVLLALSVMLLSSDRVRIELTMGRLRRRTPIATAGYPRDSSRLGRLPTLGRTVSLRC